MELCSLAYFKKRCRINDTNYHLIVCEVDDRLVASCVCVIIPNLTRNVRLYAFVENVVTHGDYRKKGYATACLNYAKQIAQENNCYKMMLLIGSKKESTLNFYKNAGYNSSDSYKRRIWHEKYICRRYSGFGEKHAGK